MPVSIGGAITIGTGINISERFDPDPTLDLGTSVTWTANTMFDTWTSSSSTTTDGTNNVDNVWQMFYAHKPLRITNGKAGARIGTTASGSNSWTWWYAVSNNGNSQTNFTSPTQIGSNSASYVSDGTYTGNFSATVNIPQYRYFLIGRVSGPFYYASRTLASNRTAVIGSTPYFTVINKLWKGGGAVTPMTIPTQLGGSSGTWTVATGISQVAGFLFDVP
jgi:hypothetical protein